jgi:hypothetical protein
MVIGIPGPDGTLAAYAYGSAANGSVASKSTGCPFPSVIMTILGYIGFDTSRVKTAYRKVADAISRNDFHAAQVKKSST